MIRLAGPFRLLSLRSGPRAVGSPLITLRTMFLAVLCSLVVIGVGVVVLWLAVLGPSDAEPVVDAMVLAPVIAVIGGAGWILLRRMDSRLDGSSDAALVSSFKTRTLLRMALGNAVAVLAFCGFVLSLNPLVYGLGFAVATANLVIFGPSRRTIARDQAQFESARSVLAALTR